MIRKNSDSKFEPFLLIPAAKDYLWGGNRLNDDFGKGIDLSPLAETWECSTHPDGPSIIANGRYRGQKLTDVLKKTPELLGKHSMALGELPILIKFIDAKGDLSVQVHPSDEYALAHEGEYGKTEMWYILDCDEGACLYYGFSKDVSREEYENAIKEGKLCDILNRVSVKKGDVFFIPAGTVHAIGAGIVICEIQQNSNTTYRVFDYNRRDKNGNLRPLHVEKALEVSSLNKSPELCDTPEGDDVLLAECEYFEVKRLRIGEEYNLLVDPSSFVSLIVTDGEGKLIYGDGELELSKGDSIFIPAHNETMIVTGNLEIIQSKVR